MAVAIALCTARQGIRPSPGIPAKEETHMIRTKPRSFKVARSWILSGLFIIGLLANTGGKALAASSGTFALTGSLNTARYGHTATLLSSGEVLAAGGLGVKNVYDPLASAEIYNPVTGKWTVTGSMSVGRMAFTATLLPNGNVLVVGGSTYAASCFATAEIYNPSTGRWTATGSMARPRCFHVAALLPSGDVLVAGGVETAFGSADTLATTELYNPSTGVWQTTGSLNVARATAAAALLESGLVLAAGGTIFPTAPLLAWPALNFMIRLQGSGALLPA